mgnify:CR=1 FL=1
MAQVAATALGVPYDAVEVRPATHRSAWQEGFAARAAAQARALPVLDRA